MPSLQAQETLYHHANDYFKHLLTLINYSQHSIYLESYIFTGDKLATNIADALCAAAQRGVNVKVMVDGAGAEQGFVNLACKMREAGVHVGIHRPLPWDIALLPFALTRYQGWRRIWYLLNTINRRNHRKLVLIDDKKLLLGSINISSGHLGGDKGEVEWRDTAIEVEHVPMDAAKQAFLLAWKAAHRPEQRQNALSSRHSPFLLNYTRRLRRLQQKMLRWKIRKARERIWITNAYFVPDLQLLKSLLHASKRGTDIRILLPRRSDIFFMPWVSATFYASLIRAGVKVYEYLPSVLHAKTLLIDDWGIVGSSNLNRRSLHHDLEIDYVLQCTQSVAELDQKFVQDCAKSKLITLDEMKLKKRWQSWLGKLLLLFFGYFV